MQHHEFDTLRKLPPPPNVSFGCKRVGKCQSRREARLPRLGDKSVDCG